eukprot:73497-Rhodomonas_salina.1
MAHRGLLEGGEEGQGRAVMPSVIAIEGTASNLRRVASVIVCMAALAAVVVLTGPTSVFPSPAYPLVPASINRTMPLLCIASHLHFPAPSSPHSSLTFSVQPRSPIHPAQRQVVVLESSNGAGIISALFLALSHVCFATPRTDMGCAACRLHGHVAGRAGVQGPP